MKSTDQSDFNGHTTTCGYYTNDLEININNSHIRVPKLNIVIINVEEMILHLIDIDSNKHLVSDTY